MYLKAEAKKRAKELVSSMTLLEKASQLKYDSPAIERLGIPAYNWWNEGLHGVARAGTATVFPQAIAMAAMFDEEAMEQIADNIATEARAKYNEAIAHGDHGIYKGLTLWSPNINIFRDPRWGRGHETYGEDPYLTARLGVNFVKGLQGNSEYMKTAACAKHFAVHSGPEALRHEFDAKATPKDMEETYLPAFEALVKEAKVESVMGAYNRTNGEPCCGSKTLIQDILRGKWEFDGYFVSDCWAIRDFHEHHMITVTPAESAAMALKAGCDLNCGVTYLHLLKAYEQGLVREEEITQAAERLFTTRFLLGMFDSCEFDQIPYEKVECTQHKEQALEVARKSMVLLKNNGVLPFNRLKIKTIGVIGPNADSRIPLMGNYYGTSSEYITVLEGIRREAGEDVRILYSQGCHLFKDRVESLAAEQDRIAEAMSVAEHSDIVVLCLGLDETLEGEEMDTGNHVGSGDKEDLQLPKPQRELLEQICQTGKPVVVVMMSGSALDLSYADKWAQAIIQAWYPGARGGKAVAELLFGEFSPSGKLPVTFYRDLKQLPGFTDYSMKGRTYRYIEEMPLYPFGYGLSYGKVSVNSAKVLGNTAEDDIELQVGLTNESCWNLEEVVQVYIKDLTSTHAVKNHSLCAFKRVKLEAGETKEIRLIIKKDAFTVVNESGERSRESSFFLLFAGISQPDERSVELLGDRPVQVEIHLER